MFTSDVQQTHVWAQTTLGCQNCCRICRCHLYCHGNIISGGLVSASPQLLGSSCWKRLVFQIHCSPLVLTFLAQCSAAVNHLITNAVFNISSDIMMLCIPLPLLIASQLPRTKYVLLSHLETQTKLTIPGNLFSVASSGLVSSS